MTSQPDQPGDPTPDEGDGITPEQAMGLMFQVAEARHRLRRSLIWGLVWVALGGIVTLATYADAQQQAVSTGEGHYYVMWGLIVFGLWKAARATWGLIRLRRFP
jgi:hypothetical protein